MGKKEVSVLHRIKPWTPEKFKAWDALLEKDAEAALATLISFIFEAAGLSEIQLNKLNANPTLFLEELEKDEIKQDYIAGNAIYPLVAPRYREDNLKKMHHIFVTVFSAENTWTILENHEVAKEFSKWIC